MTRQRTMLALAGLVGLALAGTACWDENPTLPSPSTQNVPLTSESYTGTLAVGGAGFYSFTTTQSGDIKLTLLDLKEGGVASAAQVSLGIGQPLATGCTVSIGGSVSVGTTPQVTGSYNPGVYCARIGDVGNLTAPATFSVYIAHAR